MTNMLKKGVPEKSVQLVRGSSFRNDLLQNTYFNKQIEIPSLLMVVLSILPNELPLQKILNMTDNKWLISEEIIKLIHLNLTMHKLVSTHPILEL